MGPLNFIAGVCAGAGSCTRSPPMVFDDDIIGGAPAAWFTRRLVELIESGYGLEEDQTMITFNPEPTAVRTE